MVHVYGASPHWPRRTIDSISLHCRSKLGNGVIVWLPLIAGSRVPEQQQNQKLRCHNKVAHLFTPSPSPSPSPSPWVVWEQDVDTTGMEGLHKGSNALQASRQVAHKVKLVAVVDANVWVSGPHQDRVDASILRLQAVQVRVNQVLTRGDIEEGQVMHHHLRLIKRRNERSEQWQRKDKPKAWEVHLWRDEASRRPRQVLVIH